MTLDPNLFDEACDSALSKRMVSTMFTARMIRRMTAHDPLAGAEAFGRSPAACTAAALAEAETLPDAERLEVIGEIPERAAEYNARAFGLIDEALAVLDLPEEVVSTITGDMIALYGAALLAADVQQAGRNAEGVDDDTQAA